MGIVHSVSVAVVGPMISRSKVPESRNQPDSLTPFCSMSLAYPHLFKLNVFIMKDKMVGCQVDCSRGDHSSLSNHDLFNLKVIYPLKDLGN